MRTSFYCVLASALFIAACGDPEPVVQPPAASVAERLMDERGWEPVDYDRPDRWACRGEADDFCHMDYAMTRLDVDGSRGTTTLSPDFDAPVDCFFIYPTLNFNIFQAANHEDLDKVSLPNRVVTSQAGPFSSVCRMFAPYYRQGTFGAYATQPIEEGAWRFRNAFVDIAHAFEHYLQHWNDGRPLVIMGHSQGAQMASYLLHSYFDGEKQVTTIPGSETSSMLRERLVAALPIGFNVFVPRDERVGGAFSDIPLCAEVDETGCAIHYRTYPEGFTFTSTWSRGVDNILAEQGFLHRSFDPERDETACVNPAVGPAVPVNQVADAFGNPVSSGDIRRVEGTYLIDLIAALATGERMTPQQSHLPARYTAACRHDENGGNYLAIGLYSSQEVPEQRGDPLWMHGPIASGPLGLHLQDFTVPMADLIEQVRRKSVAFAEGQSFP